MAQAHREEKPQEMHMKDTAFTTSSSGSFKFNAQAPEFVPQTHTQVPVSGYFYPYYHLLDGSSGGPDWFYVGDQDPISFLSSSTATPSYSSKNVLTDDLRRKIIKQVYTSSFLGFFLHGSIFLVLFWVRIDSRHARSAWKLCFAKDERIKILNFESVSQTQNWRSPQKVILF